MNTEALPRPSVVSADSDGRHLKAGLMLLLAAGSWSTAPAIIHLTATGSNPFVFNAVDQSTIVVLLLIFVLLTRRRWHHAFGQHDTEAGSVDGLNRHRVLSLSLFTSYIGPSPESADAPVDLQTAALSRPRTWLRLPLLWLAVGGLDIALFAWSARYVETAIAATIFELWPCFVVVMLVRHSRTHRLYLDRRPKTSPDKDRRNRGQITLTVVAGVGLAFMMLSQAETGTRLSSIVSFEDTLGIVLALLASAGASLNVVASLIFGRTAYYRFLDSRQSSAPADHREDSHRLLLWFTLVGVIAGRILAASVSGVLGAFGSSAYGGIAFESVVGGLVLGTADASAIVLIRVGNTLSNRPGINAVSFITPVLGLTWLLFLGISLPRLDLFIVGAALILAVNVLLQLKPDEERDYSRFGKAPQQGTRLGFTAFIMSIWVFGTFIYLRDEWLPAEWLSWPIGEYWGMLALAATVFSLILGFRMARLTARVSHEDELMLRLFRDCEQLAREEKLDGNITECLSALDTARPKQLLRAYSSSRNLLRDAICNSNRDERLLDAERMLDAIAHSKQQGRDVAELMSLLAFAVVTVGLGLFSRPFVLGIADHAWSGFIVEVFVLLLVSTVSFLAINLFDIRRERETPLLVPVKEHDGDYGLFFRHKANRTVEHTVSVIISAALACAFAVLLYDKWQ